MRAAMLRALAAAIIAVQLGWCLAASDVRKAELPVWPPAPAAARIEFVRAFSSAEDLGISKSFLQRISDFFLGAAQSRVQKPMAVVARGGIIHVADPGAGGVHRFDTRRGRYALVKGPRGKPLPSPVGLALDARGTVYVADSVLGRVFKIAPDADEATPLTLGVAMKHPTGIAIAGDGRMYVVDTATHRINVFASSGELVGTLGSRGAGPGEFNFPTHIALAPDGRLYVNDALNFRIQVFEPDGRFVRSFGRQGDAAGDAARQKGVAVDRYGHVYALDALLHALQVFDAAGRVLLSLGARGHEPGEFWLPTGLFIDREDGDTIYIADSYNHRVQVMRYVGGPD